MKRNIVFLVVLGILLAVILTGFNKDKSGGDFLAYWSATHLFASGGNPYDHEAMSKLQRSASPERYSDGSATQSAWNPPWLILFLLPIGFLPFNLAFITWIFCNVLLIGLAALFTWKLCKGHFPSRGLLLVFILVFLFVETLAYLAIGQVTSIILLSIVLFIYFTERGQDWQAGMVLLMATIKPHISYLFLILVFIWTIKNHRWKVILGALSLTIFSMVIFWLFIPSWVSDYRYLLVSLPYTQLYTSTIGNFISNKYQIDAFKYSALILLFFIPPLLRIIEKEGFLIGTNLALLISIPLSPYGFNFDHIVIIPAMIQIVAWFFNHELTNKIFVILVGGFLLVNLLVAKMISINGLEQFWFFWIPIPILVLYLIGKNNRNVLQQSPA